ncbi:hypothetical protein SASPL_143194 [Salvia splendens]|uniref:Remorin C-terminal domain-containing protein n=1 Tax=Salvia splendens TaxID=180675 RepID=A0A8X8ZA33_SALSN|nr:hypothetical protein SASPL_143194 [Salvia splendens]
MGEETKSVNGKDESTAAAAAVLPAEEKADYNDVLAKVEIEKKLSLIKAWEENEKTKAENKAHKKLSAVDAWENTKRAAVEAELKQIEVRIFCLTEEKRAMIEEDRSKHFLKAEEMAAECRTTATIPKISCACFSF